VAQFTSAASAFPAVSSNVTLTLGDASPFAGKSAGDHIFTTGGIFAFVSTTGVPGGTLTVTYLGLGGARISVAAS
jgi:hypothetical protein